MPAHLEVDDTHKDFVFTAEQKAKWEVGEEEKTVLQLGWTAWQKQLSREKSAKEKKRVREKRHKLKGEVPLQREILTKAAERRKRHHAASKKRRHVGQQEKETKKQKQLWRYGTSGTQNIKHTAATIAKAKATATATSVVAATAAATAVRAAAAATVAVAVAAQ